MSEILFWGKENGLRFLVHHLGQLLHRPVHHTTRVPETRAMLIAIMEEILKIGRARDVNLGNDVVQNIIIHNVDQGSAEVIASMHKAILEGKPSELDDQTGAVVRMGRQLGIPTPTNDFIYAALLPMELKARGRI